MYLFRTLINGYLATNPEYTKSINPRMHTRIYKEIITCTNYVGYALVKYALVHAPRMFTPIAGRDSSRQVFFNILTSPPFGLVLDGGSLIFLDKNFPSYKILKFGVDNELIN